MFSKFKAIFFHNTIEIRVHIGFAIAKNASLVKISILKKYGVLNRSLKG